MSTFPLVTLIGSTKFMDEIREEAVRLTLAGFIVIAPHVVSSEQVIETEASVKSMLVQMHLAKIDLAQRVHVVNPGGYIGEHTQFEIEYATHRGMPVTYYEGHPELVVIP